jgi:hypothetical protein
MRNTKVIAVVLCVVALAVAGLIFARIAPKPRILGTLPAQDVAEIQRTVNREIWRRVWPDFSWQSFKRLPSNLAFSSSAHIEQINLESKPFVVVMVGREKAGVSNAVPSTHLVYFLRQQTNGWQVISVSPIFGTLLQSSPDGMHPFNPAPDYFIESGRSRF